MTLLELLFVIAILGLLVGLTVPSSQPSLHDQLRAAASVLAGDLQYANALAVANGSSYSVVFDLSNNSYRLIHSGNNPSLNVLPRSPFAADGASANEYVVKLAELPGLSASVRLAAVLSHSRFAQSIDRVEFGPLGQTTTGNGATIWLAAGTKEQARYLPVSVDGITGLVTIGQYTNVAPAPQVLQATPISSLR